MRVLVTGAHGFLGSHVAARLASAGHEVRALVSPWGALHNLEGLIASGAAEVVRADIAAPVGLGGAMEGVEGVVHAAARVADWGPWSAFEAANVLGTERLVEAAAAAGARRFLLVSSVAVHTYSGFRDADPRTVPRDNVTNPYAYSKILAEDIVLAERRLEGVVVRPGLWPFGERDRTFKRVARAVARGTLPLIGGGNSVLNTAYAGNFAVGVELALTMPAAAGKVYLLADDGVPSWRDVFSELARLLGSRAPRLSLPPGPTLAVAAGVEAAWSSLFPSAEPPLTRYRASVMAKDVHFSTEHAATELGFRPAVSWQDGLRATVAALSEEVG